MRVGRRVGAVEAELQAMLHGRRCGLLFPLASRHSFVLEAGAVRVQEAVIGLLVLEEVEER